MNFAVCQDPNAGARAAAKERNNQKIAIYKQNAVKYWNKETSFAKNRKFISGMGYSRDYSDLQEQIETARGKVLSATEKNQAAYMNRAIVDEGGRSRTAGRADRLRYLYSKQKEIDAGWSKLGRFQDKALTGLQQKVSHLHRQNKSQLGLPPTFAGYEPEPGVDKFGMAMSGLKTGLTIAAMFTGSDLRLKRDVEIVGKSPEGYKIYEYAYAGNPIKRFRGVMAQDVMKKNPMAVHINERGFFNVDYSKVDVEFQEVN